MTKITLSIIALCVTLSTRAFSKDMYVHGYTRSNGTQVQGYHRTTPDGTVNNNYGTRGNINPYTHKEGTTPRNHSQGAGEYNTGNGESHKSDD